MRNISIPSQLLKWQQRILLVGNHLKTKELLPQIKWRNYDHADTLYEAIPQIYDYFLTPNPVDIILLEDEAITSPFDEKETIFDSIADDDHLSNIPVILLVPENKAVSNISKYKKYPQIKYHILKEQLNEVNLIVALSHLLLNEDIKTYRQNKLRRNLLMNALFKDHRIPDTKRSITPHFQKLVNISTGETEGYELLLRWKHKGKNIPPDEFIPLAEKTRTIRYVDQLALEYADEYSDYLIKQNKFVTVNVSPINLNSEEYVLFLEMMVKRNPKLIKVLRLEITETAILKNLIHLLRINALEIKIILDDFGKGESNFELLYDLARKKIISKMKIDRGSFQKYFNDGQVGKKVLKKHLQAYEVLGIEILVEGVETIEQLEFLKKMRIPIWGQGYYFGKPEPIAV